MSMFKRKSGKDAHCRKIEHHIQELRNLLSGQRVVALDTCVLGELELDMPPLWFKNFQTMRDDGVRFVIPDLCVGERLRCFANANHEYHHMMTEKWRKMVLRLDSIIWKDLPCVPLRGDLFDIVGIQEKDISVCRESPFTKYKARELYDYFHGYENSQFNSPEYRLRFEIEIEKVRDEWKKMIESFRGVARETPKEHVLLKILETQNQSFFFPDGNPVLVELPFRFLIERSSDQSYCNPALGKRTKNDGLDFLMLYLTIVSINVCSTDRFFKMAHDYECVGSCCCHTPDTLFLAWQTGNLSLVEL